MTRKLPRVTDILKPYTDFSMIRPEVLEHARERGQIVHKYCAAFMKGIWLPPPPTECEGYFESFKRWFDQMVDRVLFVEPEFVDEDFGFMGHPDAGLQLKGSTTVVIPDWKTPAAKNKGWELQISAYVHLAEKNGYQWIERCGSLRLSPEGKMAKWDEIENWRQKFTIFLGGLNVWRFMHP